MKYILYPFIVVTIGVMWCIGKAFCLCGKHNGIEIKSSHFKNGVEIVTMHEVHCSFCENVEFKV
jgi:hypothetical protein